MTLLDTIDRTMWPIICVKDQDGISRIV